MTPEQIEEAFSRAAEERDEARAALTALSCMNCDDRLCMACVLREVHDKCVEDCPHCCVSDDPYWQRRIAAHRLRRSVLAARLLSTEEDQ